MQLDFRQIWNGLRKRWWLALLVMVTAAAVAYLYTNAQPRIYQSQTTLVAQCVPADNGCIEAVQKTMPTYAQQLGSQDFWRQVIDENLMRDVNVDSLPGQIQVQPRPDQNSIVMTVDNEDPARAQILADRIGRAFVEQQAAQNQTVTAGAYKVVWTVTGAASLPDRPYQPRPLLYSAAAALFGLILGLLLAIALELLDTTLKTPSDIQQFTGLNTLGIIPRS